MKFIKIVVSILVILSIILYSCYLYLSSFNSFLSYLKNNPDKYSLVASVDNELICQHNPKKLFYIASTKKILILVELANQLKAGNIQDNKKIPISEIDMLYLKGLDGGAHEKWKEKLFSNKIRPTVTLDEVVNGMIEFSSNACTDYILNLLTIDSVNLMANKLGVNNPKEYLYFNSLIFADTMALKNSKYDELRKSNMTIFNKMKNGKMKMDNVKPSVRFQELLIERTENASAEDFHKIITKIYSESDKSPAFSYVKRHLGWIINKKDNRKFFSYFGGKGGSLLGVLTYSCFAVNKEKESVNFNFFINNMDYHEWYFYQDSFIAFRNKFCKSKSERDLILSQLNSSK